MSYCRFSDGDVYMYPSVDGIVCCCCRLNCKDSEIWCSDILLKTPKEALKHLKEHIYAGHKVPKYATDRLKEEITVTCWKCGETFEDEDSVVYPLFCVCPYCGAENK